MPMTVKEMGPASATGRAFFVSCQLQTDAVSTKAFERNCFSCSHSTRRAVRSSRC